MRKKPAMAAALCVFLASYTSCTVSSDSAETHKDTKYTAAIPDPPLPGLDTKAPLPTELSEVLDAKGPDYEPRTHHLEPDGSPTFTNRLIREASPYLLQHAHNPVNWYPWSDEAFERARAEGKLILMSIGYSTCHWCHVMERESFEDLIIAAYMNENYIAIKVDREERPDIDSIYMTAVNMLAGRGGWPMTTILTPDREPAFGGTYFPPSRFLALLKDVRQKYVNNPADLLAEASSLSRRIQQASEPKRPQSIPGPTAIANAATANARSFDSTWGGFGGAPKFPRPSTLELLLRYHRRTGDPQALQMVEVTLEKMAAGGMHDHVGGGFHRYSTDARWLVPHFEKMLYDNAQLAVAYLEGYQVTGREDFAEVARGILDYVLREMTHAKGGFFSATDADSPTGKGHDEEGLFFTWTPAEIRELLDAEASKTFQTYYGVTAGGNFEGRNILNTPKALDTVAKQLGTSPAVLGAQLAKSRGRLYAQRKTRLPPLLDNKILAAWNGLMISALARAGLILTDRRYAEAASNAASFVLQHMTENGELMRSWRDDVPGSTGVLDDYAFFIAALLDLYEATYEPKWLHHAKTLQATLDREFGDFNLGGYFLTRKGTKGLLTREKPSYDGAEPSGNSVALLNVLRFEQMTGDAVYRETAERGFAAFAGTLVRSGRSMPKMLTALDYYLDEPLQIVIVSTTEDEPKELMDVLRKAFVPNKVLSVGMEGLQIDKQAREFPLVAGKRAQGDKATAYVCRRNVCELPTSDPNVFAKQLRQIRPLMKNPSKLPVAEPGKQPKPWQYDRKTNKHWHPGHGHWHDGRPPNSR